jgi:hypothetical protein
VSAMRAVNGPAHHFYKCPPGFFFNPLPKDSNSTPAMPTTSRKSFLILLGVKVHRVAARNAASAARVASKALDQKIGTSRVYNTVSFSSPHVVRAYTVRPKMTSHGGNAAIAKGTQVRTFMVHAYPPGRSTSHTIEGQEFMCLKKQSLPLKIKPKAVKPTAKPATKAPKATAKAPKATAKPATKAAKATAKPATKAAKPATKAAKATAKTMRGGTISPDAQRRMLKSLRAIIGK